jgi:hypothetical protein
LQVERERAEELERAAQQRIEQERVARRRREHDRAARAMRMRNVELEHRNRFEMRMFQERALVHHVPFGETEVEWKNRVIGQLRQLDVQNEYLFRESNPANNAYSAVRIVLPNGVLFEGCRMIEIEFIPENRSFIVTVYEYSFLREVWRMTINPGGVYVDTVNQLFHICEESMRRTLGILAEMRRDMQEPNYFEGP